MTPNHLLTLFDRVSDAPDAIPRLRRFILDLAVRGKLVEQSVEDEPASMLLARIAAAKSEAAVGRRKAAEGTNLITSDVPPFAIPTNWAWARLGDVSDLVRGISFPASAKSNQPTSEAIPCFRSGNIQNDLRWSDFIYVPRHTLTSPAQMVRKDDILISIANSYELVGKCTIVDQVFAEATFGAFLAAIRLYLTSARFMKYCLASGYSVDSFRTGSAQTTNIANITFSTIRSHHVPLPPLAEQQRIVARVDELMALCDQLEAAQAAREAQRDRLAAASLQRLNEPADDPADFREHVSFHLSNLPRLITRPEHIPAIRQTILNLAVRGKLVPQDPNDEPVFGGTKYGKQGSALTRQSSLFTQVQSADAPEGQATPYEIPSTWAWAKVGDVSDCRLGKMLDKGKNKGTPHRYLRNINVRWLDFNLSDVLEMRFEDGELDEFSLRSGDVLICEGGEPGRAAVWDARESDIYFQKALHRVRFDSSVLPEWFVRVISLDAGTGRLRRYFTGTGIKHFTGKGLARYSFPIPPFAEQSRIVNKVNELLAVCDELSGALARARAESRRLLEAVLHEALAPVAHEPELTLA